MSLPLGLSYHPEGEGNGGESCVRLLLTLPVLSLVSASKSQGSSNTGNLQQTSPNRNVNTSCLESLLKDSSESIGLGWGLRFSFLTSSYMEL